MRLLARTRLDESRHPIAAAYLRHRYAILFYSVLLTLVAGPLLLALGLGLTLLQVLFTANLLAAVVPSQRGLARRALTTAVVLAAGLRLLAAALDSSALEHVANGVAVLVALQTVAMALRYSFSGARVDREHVYAALGAFLLFGVFFGVLFASLQTIDPETFAVAGEPGTIMTIPTGIYFSFITLATVGYGDIVPKSDLARGLAVLETVAGQLYLAVLVARLVGLHAPRSRQP